MIKIMVLSASLVLAGCAGASKYEYKQTDYDDLSGREVITHVTDEQEATVPTNILNDMLVLGFTGIIAAAYLVSQ
jgi:hypothetical protein